MNVKKKAIVGEFINVYCFGELEANIQAKIVINYVYFIDSVNVKVKTPFCIPSTVTGDCLFECYSYSMGINIARNCHFN